jgi:hypothetical protein
VFLLHTFHLFLFIQLFCGDNLAAQTTKQHFKPLLKIAEKSNINLLWRFFIWCTVENRCFENY